MCRQGGEGTVGVGWWEAGMEGLSRGAKGIPYLLGHSMVRVELIHPVESSSSLRLATLLQSICQVDEEKFRGEQKKEERRRGAHLGHI